MLRRKRAGRSFEPIVKIGFGMAMKQQNALAENKTFQGEVEKSALVYLHIQSPKWNGLILRQVAAVSIW
ncbi:MAG TPA: hypothetical protein VHM90_15825 [Phycisphaerae bacterium]|nr:hypothetical protein [Phycisphaerae bacterium]